MASQSTFNRRWHIYPWLTGDMILAQIGLGRGLHNSIPQSRNTQSQSLLAIPWHPQSRDRNNNDDDLRRQRQHLRDTHHMPSQQQAPHAETFEKLYLIKYSNICYLMDKDTPISCHTKCANSGFSVWLSTSVDILSNLCRPIYIATYCLFVGLRTF